MKLVARNGRAFDAIARIILAAWIKMEAIKSGGATYHIAADLRGVVAKTKLWTIEAGIADQLWKITHKPAAVKISNTGKFGLIFTLLGKDETFNDFDTLDGAIKANPIFIGERCRYTRRVLQS